MDCNEREERLNLVEVYKMAGQQSSDSALRAFEHRISFIVKLRKFKE